MSAAAFAFWLADMRKYRGWTAGECARQLGCGVNQTTRWSRNGAPRYIGLACAALVKNVEPYV